MNWRRLAITVCCLALLGLGTPRLSAQETINLASITGRVTDETGGVLPGAVVVARQTDTDVTTRAVTDQEGRYRIPYLHVGTYELVISLQGFTSKTRRVVL